MNPSPACVALVKRFEGLRLAPYQCQAHVWTLGYGHTAGVVATTPHITPEQAEEWLEIDLKRYAGSVTRLIRPVPQPMFDALVSFTFNLGGGALQRSTLRQRLNRGDYEGAAAEFMKWTRAAGVVSKGLFRRRKAERELFLTGLKMLG